MALQQVRPGREVVVWTDQPVPSHLPDWVDWRNQDFLHTEALSGVILQALPVDASHWNVSWALSENVSARITCGDWSSKPLSGLAGVTLVEVADPGSDLRLEFVQQASTNGASWGSVWPSLELEFQIPNSAHPAWKDAVLAAWPSIGISYAESAGVLVQGVFQPPSPSLQELEWQLEPQPQGIGTLAKDIRATAQLAAPPRDIREYMPRLLPSDLDANDFLRQPSEVPRGLPLWLFGALWLGVFSVVVAWWQLSASSKLTYSEV
ncbi:MAG: hypothetical protein QM477_07965 [Planctomycetota bacterium]